MDSEQIETSFRPAAMKALESFPVDAAHVEFIKHSENVTFRVSAHGSDTDYVLRLHRPGYCTIEELNSERMWTRALKEAGIAVPSALRTIQGQQNYVLIDIPDIAEQRYAGVTIWLEGSPLADFLETTSDEAERARQYRKIGEIAASIHNQSAGWKAPPGFVRRRLDLDGLLGEAPFWGRFWEHADLTEVERTLLLRARDKVRAALSAYGMAPGNFSLIHADIDPYNIICNGDDLALIDFDDSAYGWHMYEIASALIDYKCAPDFDELQAALLEGYREHRTLAKKDIEMLPVFLLVRGMAIIGWFHQRPEHDGSDLLEEVKNWVLAECD